MDAHRNDPIACELCGEVMTESELCITFKDLGMGYMRQPSEDMKKTLNIDPDDLRCVMEEHPFPNSAERREQDRLKESGKDESEIHEELLEMLSKEFEELDEMEGIGFHVEELCIPTFLHWYCVSNYFDGCKIKLDNKIKKERE